MFKPYESTEGVVQPFVIGPEQEAWLHHMETTDTPKKNGGAIVQGDPARCALALLHDISSIPYSGITCYVGIGDLLAMKKGSTPDGQLADYTYYTHGRGAATPKIWHMNDTLNMSFREIAAAIRANPQEYFSEPR